MAAEKRYPTHRLNLWNPETKEQCEIGVGWQDDGEGHISIKLKPGVQLTYWDLARGGLKLTLFPVTEDEKAEREQFKRERRVSREGNLPPPRMRAHVAGDSTQQPGRKLVPLPPETDADGTNEDLF